jgi:ParB-like chromosome segregation protein Spo0J
MEYHEYANLFPMMPKPEVERLAGDIKEKGLQDDIITLDGKILDGRNRHAACAIAGVEPRFTEYQGADPLGFVVSHNLHRRHLNESQRGQVAARIAKLPIGANQHSPIGLPTQKQAAEMLNVSRNTVKRSKTVLEHGIPELADMQQSGEVSAAAAESVARLPEAEQRQAVAGGVAGVKAAAKKRNGNGSKEIPQTSQSTSSPEQKQTSRRERAPSYHPDDAERLWAVAFGHLEKISATDKSREKVLRRIIAYCEKRIQENK